MEGLDVCMAWLDPLNHEPFDHEPFDHEPFDHEPVWFSQFRHVSMQRHTLT